MIANIQPCLWFDGNAEEASRSTRTLFQEVASAPSCARPVIIPLARRATRWPSK